MKCTEFTLFSFLPSLFFLRKIKFSIISIQGNKATTPTQELKPKCVFKIIKVINSIPMKQAVLL